MTTKINQLEPQAVWTNFEKICSFPHPSKHEEKLRTFIKESCEKIGLKTLIDKGGNLIVVKKASAGMENRKGVILQAHLDMVPQKNNNTHHDFEKDSIKPFVDGEWVKAKGTTLGADNGIGAAIILSILQSDEIKYCPLEALFTIDEETGMTGAFNLGTGILNGDILLNLDSEDDDELCVGCAGGLNANITFHFKKESFPTNASAYKLSLFGLKGGHSGVDIHLGRGNSNKLMVRFLKFAVKKFGIRLSMFEGGNMRNAIPRETFVTLAVPKTKEYDFIISLKKHLEVFKNEFSEVEPDLNFISEKISLPEFVLDETSNLNLINTLYACPNGVMRMSDSINGLVETSLNLAIVKTEKNSIYIKCLLRSSVDSSKVDLANMVSSVFELTSCDISFDGDYPGWKPNMNSQILSIAKNIYEKRNRNQPHIRAIHAGLECGIIGSVYPNLDMISIGPTIKHPHSPDEKVSIKSVKLFYEFLQETLKNIPKK